LIPKQKTRRLISLVLAVLLVAIQQTGFAHALTHLANPASQKSSRTDTQHPAEKVCTECVVFAQLGSALTAKAAPVTVLAARVEIAAAPFRRFDLAFVCYFLSRAPPLPV
jgi:hypothetical protein